jgi:hypothetical protein
MSDSASAPRPRRHPAAAAIAAGVVFIVFVVVRVIDGVEGVVYTQGVTMQSLDGFEYAGVALPATIEYVLWRAVPFALGVFLSFWLIAPVRPGLRLVSTVLRSLVAVVIGVVLLALTTVARSIADNQLALNPGPGAAVDDRVYLLIAGSTSHEAWTVFTDAFPLVIAVGLAMWAALGRREVDVDRPPRLDAASRD